MIDAEAVAIDHLTDAGAVTAIAGERIAAEPPASLADPFVRVRLLNAPESFTEPGDYLIAYLLQFDCYAGADGTTSDALALAGPVRDALGVMPTAELDATVTGVKIVGFQRLEDVDISPPRPRYIVTATIWAHP